MTLEDYIKEKFSGIMVFADVHGDIKSIERAYEYASANDLFFMSLGDLVDRGPNPYEVVMFMHQKMKQGAAGFTIGNHDDKFVRFHQGREVRFSKDGRATIESVGEARMKEFLEAYTEMSTMPVVSGICHKIDDFVFVHAATHRTTWDGSATLSKSGISRALVGKTSKEYDDEGYPIRLYSWVDKVPTGKCVIVGHDRAPIHRKYITEPLVVQNAQGGKVIFLDTGCGKGGFLSGAVITHDKKFKFSHFVSFKD